MEQNIETQMKTLNLDDFTQYEVLNLIHPGFKITLPTLTQSFHREIENIILTPHLLKFSQNTLDLTKVKGLQNSHILKALLGILGSINQKNDFTLFTSEFNSNINPSLYFENRVSLVEYIRSNIATMFSEFKIVDFKNFIFALEDIGIDIGKTSLYTEIKNFIFGINKILIVITPSSNFWIKNENEKLNGKIFDRRMNKFNCLYYNWEFIKMFYDRVANHPRCLLGYLSSMTVKNLKPCIEFITIRVKNFTKFVIFDQSCHQEVMKEGSKKPEFTRDLMKIIKTAQINNEIDETNTLIIESEMEKNGNCASNSIGFSCFDEKFDGKDHEGLINYLVVLLDECEGDIREYIALKNYK